MPKHTDTLTQRKIKSVLKEMVFTATETVASSVNSDGVSQTFDKFPFGDLLLVSKKKILIVLQLCAPVHGHTQVGGGVRDGGEMKSEANLASGFVGSADKFSSWPMCY